MWSSMLKKKVVPQPQAQIAAAITSIKSNLIVTHTTNLAASKQNQDDKPSSEEGKDRLEIPLYDPEALSNNLLSEPEQHQEDTFNLDEGQAEEEAESMLRLMQEMQHLREQSQALTDDERRKKAEEMIIKLSQYMQLDDGEDEFEDDQED